MIILAILLINKCHNYYYYLVICYLYPYANLKSLIMNDQKHTITLKGSNDILTIRSDDIFAKKMAMLIERLDSTMTIEELAKKYGYTREHYYHIRRQFNKYGSEALNNKKRGPKHNYVRTDIMNNQIIRFRFLDPGMSPGVIGQKLRQMGYHISDRSVSRTIREYGLQKKTLRIKSSRQAP